MKPIGMTVTECNRLVEPLRKHATDFDDCFEKYIIKEILHGSRLGDKLINQSSALFNDLKTIGENASTCAYDKKRVEEQGVKLDCAMQVNNINRLTFSTLLVKTYGTYNQK